MDQQRLDTYSTALMENFDDDAATFAVLTRLSLCERGEYELAIPTKATLIRMAEEFQWAIMRQKREAEEKQREEEKRRIIEAERAEEGYQPFDFAKPVADTQERINARPKREITCPLNCPQCGHFLNVQANLRFWTADDHRKHADTLDELARIAAANAAQQQTKEGEDDAGNE